MSADDRLPITTLIPESAREAAFLYDQHAALRMALIEREGTSFLPAGWDAAGIYVLLYPHEADGTFRIYVGKAPTGLRGRVMEHVARKEGWTRALLVARDTSYGFNSAQVGWLEGRVWTLANASARGKLENGNQPKDETLPPYERAALEPAIVPIRRVLRFLGYSLEPEDDTPGPKSIKRVKVGVTVADLIRTGRLAVGTTIHFTWPGYPASATIEPDGRIALNGKLYESLSAAGQAVRGGATNGWAYWAVTDAKGNQVPLAEIRSEYVAAQPANGQA